MWNFVWNEDHEFGGRSVHVVYGKAKVVVVPDATRRDAGGRFLFSLWSRRINSSLKLDVPSILSWLSNVIRK